MVFNCEECEAAAMKCVGIIGTLDTKREEILYFKAAIEKCGLAALVIDCSLGRELPQLPPGAVSRTQVFRHSGLDEMDLPCRTKAELLERAQAGAATVVGELYAQGRIHALGAIGGMQNTLLAAAAMQALPVGVPKVICSTIAGNGRQIPGLEGDVMLLPAVADIMGLNTVTRVQIENTAAALAGMTLFAGHTVEKSGPVIGMLANGVTSKGALQTLHLLEDAGFEVISFHASGRGWGKLEEMIQAKTVDAVLCYALIEMTCGDLLHAGYAQGSRYVLRTAVEMGLPILATPGGLDFVDFSAAEYEARQAAWAERPVLRHNSGIVHVKLSREEGRMAGELLARRLNEGNGPVSVVIPARGFRSDVGVGEPLYDPAVDQEVIDGLLSQLRTGVKVITLDTDINAPAFSEAVQREMLLLMGRGPAG